MKRLAALAFALLAPLLASAQYNSYTNYPAGTAPSYAGLWWNPGESGWGLSMEHQGDVIFAVWYTFDKNGAPTWFAMPDLRLMNDNMGDMTGMGDMEMMMGMSVNPPIFTGTLYRPSMVNGKLVMTAVGNATVLFKARKEAVFAYSVGNFASSKNVSKMSYSSEEQTCALGGAKGTSANYQGLYFNPLDSGWGVNLAHQGDTLFATYYTYDSSGSPTWYAASNTVKYDAGALAFAAFQGPVLQASGPSYDAPWDASKVSVAQVGTVDFLFNSRGDASMFAHGSVTRRVVESLARMQFAAPSSVCR